MPEFPLFLGGRENKLYFALYGSRNRVGGGENSEGFSLSENHTSCK
ncbi:hypothetical protein LEP1GSC051_1316 [Leptospira sp. P2653]|nr:hypothetical protein LEP1GSC051_1316 [Leptospira sp. P2653]